MPQGTVEDHICAGRPFIEQECRQMLVQALDAPAYLYSQVPQIVQRDIKPSNVCLFVYVTERNKMEP